MKEITAFLAFNLLVLCTYAQVQRKTLPNADSVKSGIHDSRDNKIRKNELDKKGSKQERLKELDLTFAQKRKMRDLQLANKSKRVAIENDPLLSESQKKERLKELQKEGLNNLKQVLSDEQMEKLRAIRSKRKVNNQDMDQ